MLLEVANKLAQLMFPPFFPCFHYMWLCENMDIPQQTHNVAESRYNVAATSRHCSDAVATLLHSCVFAGTLQDLLT